MNEDPAAPAVHVSRGLKEVVAWRYVSDMIRRYPDRLWVYQAERETWDDLSQPNLLRIAIAFPRFEGAYGHFDLLEGDTYRFHTPEGFSEMPDVWRMTVESDNLGDVLNHLLVDIGLYEHMNNKMPATSPTSLVYRLMAGISASTVFSRHSWRWANAVRLNGEWLEPALRTTLLKSFPGLDVPEPRYSDIGNARFDPAYGYWILTKNRAPLVCLSLAGLAHYPDGRRLDLMPLYAQSRESGRPGRLAPVIHAFAHRFLP